MFEDINNDSPNNWKKTVTVVVASLTLLVLLSQANHLFPWTQDSKLQDHINSQGHEAVRKRLSEIDINLATINQNINWLKKNQEDLNTDVSKLDSNISELRRLMVDIRNALPQR